MIEIQQSKTADTRTCDFSKVPIEQLMESSRQHIGDVKKGIEFIKECLDDAATKHDSDKIAEIHHFHSDFITGFKRTEWWDNHRKIARHHLSADDGVPADVNLIDVLDMIVDCVMAGMGRSGSVYPLQIKDVVLQKAFQNTVEMVKAQVVIESHNTGDKEMT